jgi:hypothetical protein
MVREKSTNNHIVDMGGIYGNAHRERVIEKYGSVGKIDYSGKVKRRLELLKKYRDEKKKYIIELSGKKLEDIKDDDEKFIAYCDGEPKYNELFEKGDIPIYCKVLENIHNKKREIAIGSLENDLVYNFLSKLEKNVVRIATAQYEKIKGLDENLKGGEFENEFDYEQDLDFVQGTKSGFVGELIHFIEERGDVGENIGCDWSKDAKLNEARYHWLKNELADYQGANKKERIEEFVENMPSYPWDNFYWECD